MATCITSFNDPGLSWLNNPSSWGVEDATGQKEGSQGRHEVLNNGSELLIQPPAFKDFWRRTYYSPTLIKSDASGLLCSIAASEECTVQIDFKLTAVNQFDQAGILVYLDNSHWVKAGIEFCDGTPRLSCVVCNVFSDWSTQPWLSGNARLRIHKVNQGSTIVVEAAPFGSEEFEFVRIAHISAMASHRGADLEPEAGGQEGEVAWRVGPFAACPMAQKGCSAHFSGFSIGPYKGTVHSSDASDMT